MKRKSILIIILIFVFSYLTFGQVQNIKLVSGEKKILKGSVKAGDENERLYIFETKAGQQLTVNISSTNNNAVFSVNEQYRVDRSPIEINGEPVQDKKEEWSGVLPEVESNGLYSVSVTSNSRTATFTLEITLEKSANSVTKSTSEKPQTIKDFYLLMPKKYDGKSKAQRQQSLENAETNETIDIKNGYFRDAYKGDTIEICEAAIFKKSGGYILAYNEDYDDVHNEKPASTKLFFLDYADGQWIDVTTQLMPLPINRKYQYKLPQIGTTIEVWDGAGKMYTLLWKNGKFVKEAK